MARAFGRLPRAAHELTSSARPAHDRRREQLGPHGSQAAAAAMGVRRPSLKCKRFALCRRVRVTQRCVALAVARRRAQPASGAVACTHGRVAPRAHPSMEAIALVGSDARAAHATRCTEWRLAARAAIAGGTRTLAGGGAIHEALAAP